MRPLQTHATGEPLCGDYSRAATRVSRSRLELSPNKIYPMSEARKFQLRPCRADDANCRRPADDAVGVAAAR
ncbi:hypothetical protein EVAR_64180_1 [Eumeta japonica]|uniref:Uncharacterized protein n=1 Tax=Eumeta variegata TaxID=151549 RepID=A0A4C1ZEN6_EUMVA|nr:hypothetical protein EVAR_64180_1 [Eumeta japonica]